MYQASSSCLRLLKQRTVPAFALALASAGNNRPARIAIIAMTTSSSIRVKAARRAERLSPFRTIVAVDADINRSFLNRITGYVLKDSCSFGRVNHSQREAVCAFECTWVVHPMPTHAPPRRNEERGAGFSPLHRPQ